MQQAAYLRSVLDDLYAEGGEHDAAQPDRLRRRRNLEPDAAALLALTTRMLGARRIVEIGTSNGVSTIWLADAARATGGRVTSVDLTLGVDVEANLTRAGVRDLVDLREADGGAVLAELPDASVDLLFLDSERTEYEGWLPHPIRVVRPGGVLAVDNALAPSPDELRGFFARIAVDDRLVSTTVPVGKGLFLAWRPVAAAAQRS
ncbi:O-methyltransferase [Pseudonocardia sp. TRM90224]|uniref:O-methyltransferase n=1 Tax=Pseudonocardia sp. TRM90224 TaxID=2812678 RepID=UPI001E37CF25|nr:class I SAM-dependent methyltransferase [Pseudonocardia sp. TRM90224]